MEHMHPLGVVGVITAFNFPVAVWAWTCAASRRFAAISTLWKPSSLTPLAAIATLNGGKNLSREPRRPGDVSHRHRRRATVGERMLNDKTRSASFREPARAKWGCALPTCRETLWPDILELGGNNAIVVAPSANLDLAVRAILFGAVGTAGQRCTTTRRLIVHESIRKPTCS